MNSTDRTFVLSNVSELFSRAVAEAFGRATAEEWTVSAAEGTPAQEDSITFEIICPLGSAALQLSRASALFIVEKIMAEALPAESQLQEDHLQILQGIMEDVFLSALLEAKARVSAVDLTTQLFPAPLPWSPQERIALLASTAALPPVALNVLLSSGLMKNWPKLDLDSAWTAPVPPVPAPIPASHSSETNLNLLMDVELNVTLCFGRRTLPLRDVLGFTSGSIIELDRDVQDPVELLLDNKVIARGEVVIVDGNYGLRITELPKSGALGGES